MSESKEQEREFPWADRRNMAGCGYPRRQQDKDVCKLIDAASACYRIAERNTDEFNALRDALKAFEGIK